MKMEAKRKEATRYKTDRVTDRVVEKEAKFLARVSDLSASNFFDLLARGGIFIRFSSKPCISIQECKLLSYISLVATPSMVQQIKLK